MLLSEVQTNLPPELLTPLNNHHNPQWVSMDCVQKRQICSDLLWQWRKSSIIPFSFNIYKDEIFSLSSRVCLDRSVWLWLMQTLSMDTFLLGKLHLHEYRLLLYRKIIYLQYAWALLCCKSASSFMQELLCRLQLVSHLFGTQELIAGWVSVRWWKGREEQRRAWSKENKQKASSHSLEDKAKTLKDILTGCVWKVKDIFIADGGKILFVSKGIKSAKTIKFMWLFLGFFEQSAWARIRNIPSNLHFCVSSSFFYYFPP